MVLVESLRRRALASLPTSVKRELREVWLRSRGVPAMPRAPAALPSQPWPRRADGLVAVGGDLGPERLVKAYAGGLYPWPGPEGGLLWYSPDPRFVIDLENLKIPKETARLHRQGRYRLTLDHAFDRVIDATANFPRRGGRGTWISRSMIAAWRELYRRGQAHSVECWSGEELVGGSYGLALGAAFFGESSFSLANSAGAIAFAELFTHLRARGFRFVDCQVRSAHLERFGQVAWSRTEFLMRLSQARERAVPFNEAPSAAVASTSRL